MTPYEPSRKSVDDHVREHYQSVSPTGSVLDALTKAALNTPPAQKRGFGQWRMAVGMAAVALIAVSFVWSIASIDPTHRDVEIVVPKPEASLMPSPAGGVRDENHDAYRAVVPAPVSAPVSVNTEKRENSELKAPPNKPSEESDATNEWNLTVPKLQEKKRQTDNHLRDSFKDEIAGASGKSGGGGGQALGSLGAKGESSAAASGYDAKTARAAAGPYKKTPWGPVSESSPGHGREGVTHYQGDDLGNARTIIVPKPDRNEYAERYDSAFESVDERPLSTFGVDVDTASYSIVKKYLAEGRRPPVGAVRIEEMINAFHYDIPAPRPGQDFTVLAEAASAPWNPDHRLARVALATPAISPVDWPALNLVLLIDVSGSMQSPNKLPLAIESFSRLVRQLRTKDRISIVTYAGESGVALRPTRGSDQETVLAALRNLRAGGNTHGSAGLQLAYSLAWQEHIPDGINRVLLATDGDFNVGVTDTGDLVNLVSSNAAKGVDLTVLGFGTNNLKDARLEAIADRGDGNYAFIGSREDAERVLIKAAGSTLITAAHDVKIQVEFNPAAVAAYRLIGYENRALATTDFQDDRKDAGDVGYGHVVTALYELVPRGAAIENTQSLRYQAPSPTLERVPQNPSPESFFVKIRYQPVGGEGAREFAVPFTDDGRTLSSATDDMRFAAAVAAFGMWLRGSGGLGNWSVRDTYNLASSAIGRVDPSARAEFRDLIARWQ